MRRGRRCCWRLIRGWGRCCGARRGLRATRSLNAVRAGLPEGVPFRKMPCGISDDRLLGGLDLAATLAAGRLVAERGLLAACDGGVVVVAMAERLEPGVVARLGAAMDSGVAVAERDGMSCQDAAAFGVIALDEGIDEAAPAGLMDRLAFHCLVDGEVAARLWTPIWSRRRGGGWVRWLAGMGTRRRWWWRARGWGSRR